MFWTHDVLLPQRLTSTDASGGVLSAAARAFCQVEVEAARDPSREGAAMAEFAEIVVLPRLGTR